MTNEEIIHLASQKENIQKSIDSLDEQIHALQEQRKTLRRQLIDVDIIHNGIAYSLYCYDLIYNIYTMGDDVPYREARIEYMPPEDAEVLSKPSAEWRQAPHWKLTLTNDFRDNGEVKDCAELDGLEFEPARQLAEEFVLEFKNVLIEHFKTIDYREERKKLREKFFTDHGITAEQWMERWQRDEIDDTLIGNLLLSEVLAMLE